MLRDNANIRKNRHKVGITTPTRNNMLMKMVLHAGSGHTAPVHADIKTIRTTPLFKNITRQNRELVNLLNFCTGEFTQIGGMSIRETIK